MRRIDLMFMAALLIVLARSDASAEYVEISDLLKTTGSRLEWEPVRDIGCIVKGDETVVFKLGVPYLLLGYSQAVATEEIVRRNGLIVIPGPTAKKIEEYLSIDSAVVTTPRVAVVLIDPGHGGKDPGAVGRHRTKDEIHIVQEKDVVLDVSKRLHALLAKRYPSKTILLTRDRDVFLELEERTEMANNVFLKDNEAIIFISMHANAAFTKQSKGFEVWYLPPETKRKLIDEMKVDEESKEILPILNTMLEVEYCTESIMLAKEILSGLENTIGDASPNRGIKAENWFVVRKSKMPSVLIELGFVTNPQEAFLMQTEEYLQKLTVGVYNGIQKFISLFENTKGFTE
jgi:N-acetylmuramoyl-L-alanine amidase